ncbi:hypothetical protein ACQEVF_53125 [Nonomuraea polychroma]|uniref:hypothetical protein n=1 Tax=Nonomuraea polychroma TaxID=46176 RepID=UPI003D8FB827
MPTRCRLHALSGGGASLLTEHPGPAAPDPLERRAVTRQRSLLERLSLVLRLLRRSTS